MSALPLLAPRDLAAPIAWRAGTPISGARFVAQAIRLAERLGARLVARRDGPMHQGDPDLSAGTATPAAACSGAAAGRRRRLDQAGGGDCVLPGGSLRPSTK